MGDPEPACEWRLDCPKLKECKRAMSWQRFPPTRAEVAAERAITAARRNKGKAVRNAQRPLRIEALLGKVDDTCEPPPY